MVLFIFLHSFLILVAFNLNTDLVVFSGITPTPSLASEESSPPESPGIDTSISSSSTAPRPESADSRERAYRIGISDVLLIEIFGIPDMSKTVVVSEDGSIPYHFIGSVYCDGLTPGDLETLVTDLISPDYLKNPQVSVTIKEYNSRKVFILGEVKNPGSYVLKKTTTLIEIISQAGGLTAATGNKVMILRKKSNPDGSVYFRSIYTDSDHEVIHLDLRKLFAGDLSYNLEVKRDDTIYIPQTDYFFIIGAVKRPGTYPLESNMTILQAITIAGGFTEKASKRKVKIIRETDGEQITDRVSLELPVQSQDTIIVEESFF